MDTLVLTRADVARHLEALSLLEQLRDDLRDRAARKAAGVQHARAPLPEGAAVVDFPGASPGLPAYTVKVDARFPAQEPDTRSVLQLHDLNSGALLAVMDSDHLTRLRAGLVGAIAADVLAVPGATHVALLGATPFGRVQVKSLRLVRSLKHLRVYDPSPARAHVFAHELWTALSLPVRVEDTVQAAVEDAQIVVSALGGTEPLLYPGMLAPGAHVTAMGEEEDEAAGLAATLIRQSRLFCDDRERALASELLATELGEVLLGVAPGRTSPSEITLFSGVGLPSQDLAAAWQVYEGARYDEGVQRVDFGA
jgi:ornithine cyclodeaminase/alanine dehydrogenase-like protein (mu-crystallin family)